MLEARKSPTFGYKRRRECANEHKFTTKEVVIEKEELARERRDHYENNLGKMVAIRQSRAKHTKRGRAPTEKVGKK